jgi:hypothetical protein
MTTLEELGYMLDKDIIPMLNQEALNHYMETEGMTKEEYIRECGEDSYNQELMMWHSARNNIKCHFDFSTMKMYWRFVNFKKNKK